MNKVFLIGNLTKDPEIRSTQAGKKVASFSIAVNEGKDGTGQEVVQYFNVTAWDRTADIVESYVKRGHKICVIGKLKNRSWDKPDGTKAYATDITADQIELLTSRVEAERINQTTGSTPPTSGQSTTKAKPAETNNIHAELPEIDIDSINIQMPF
jgi:single-strand DNA-binding protein